MNNPFDEKEESTKYDTFESITDSIDSWMLNKYPLFDETLEDKINQLTEVVNKHVENQNKFDEFLKLEKEKTLKYFKDEINKFISNDHPGLTSKLNSLSCDLEVLHKKILNQSESLEKNIKKVIKSQTLADDVYKMRDDMIFLKSQVEEYTTRFKKAFQ